MKTKITLLAFLLSMVLNTGFSQEKTKKELKEERKLEKQKEVEALVDARDFVFIARTALPTGMMSVDLTTNQNYVKFKPDLIDSYMPFFGRATGSIGYGGDQGLKFTGKPDKFTVVKKKKNYQIDAEVKGEMDLYVLSLSVGFEGSTSLTIISNNRSTISYQGEISAPVKSEDK